MKTPVFYNQKMNSDIVDSISPSASKPGRFVELLQNKYPDNIDLIESKSVEKSDLARVHFDEYVCGVFDGRMVNGFGINGPQGVAMSESLLYTSGSMLDASKYVLENGGFACSPTSGFHHASYARPFGFCTFNGLFLAAYAAVMDRKCRVAIIDCDQHWGDGTYSLIKKHGLESQILQWSSGLDYWCSTLAEDMLQRLEIICHSYFKQVDLVLYQAGADQHVDDPLGGVLNTGQMSVRDLTVFSAAFRANVPLVWNLAGGYQDPVEKVLELHENTFKMSHQVQFGEFLKK